MLVHKKLYISILFRHVSRGNESKFEDLTLTMAIKMKPKPHNFYKHVIKMI